MAEPVEVNPHRSQHHSPMSAIPEVESNAATPEWIPTYEFDADVCIPYFTPFVTDIFRRVTLNVTPLLVVFLRGPTCVEIHKAPV
jgi:hypothetical protein